MQINWNAMPEWLDRITAKTDLMRKLSSESALHGEQRRYAAPDTRTLITVDQQGEGTIW